MEKLQYLGQSLQEPVKGERRLPMEGPAEILGLVEQVREVLWVAPHHHYAVRVVEEDFRQVVLG